MARPTGGAVIKGLEVRRVRNRNERRAVSKLLEHRSSHFAARVNVYQLSSNVSLHTGKLLRA